MITLAQLTPTPVQVRLWNMALKPAPQPTPTRRLHHIPKSGVWKVRFGGMTFTFTERQASRRVRRALTSALALRGAILNGDVQRLVLLATERPKARTVAVLREWEG